MTVLGKNRLNSPRSEFAKFTEGKSEATQKRYWRAYNSYWARELKSTGGSPPAWETQEPPRVGPGYHREDPAGGAIVREGGGNRFAIVVKAEFKRGKKKEERLYSIIKGNNELDDSDINQVIDNLRIEYNVGGAKITIKPVQTIDRWNRRRVIF